MTWQVEADPYEDGTPYFRFRNGDCFDDETRTGFNFSAIMSESDARLIAAAPDLRAALRQALWHLGGDADRKALLDAGFGWKTDAFEAVNLIRAALANATAVQP